MVGWNDKTTFSTLILMLVGAFVVYFLTSNLGDLERFILSLLGGFGGLLIDAKILKA